MSVHRVVYCVGNTVHASIPRLLYMLEWMYTVIFAIEHAPRLLVVKRPRTYAPRWGVIDLLSSLPTHLSLFIAGSQSLRGVRVLRRRRSLCDTASMTTDTASAAARTPADPDAFDALVDLLYHELRTIARRERLRARACATLCTTALVSEAWLRLQRSHAWRDQQHFLATAALAMRQVLVNDVHARRAEKRNRGEAPLALDEALDVAEADDSDVLLVNDAIQKLAVLSPRLARVVECRFFAGFDELATAEALGVTDRTVRRDWLKARAWLYRELGDIAGLGGDSHATA